MHSVHKYERIFFEEFYLDTDDITLRRKKDGYLGRFKQHDIAKIFTDKGGYYRIQIPQNIRSTISIAALLCLLRGFTIPENHEVDHINGNRLDNRRENLRIVSRFLNNRNRCKRSDNTSGITGLHWSEYHQHFVIRRTINGKRISRNRKTLDAAKLVLQELCTMDNTYTKRHGK